MNKHNNNFTILWILTICEIETNLKFVYSMTEFVHFSWWRCLGSLVNNNKFHDLWILTICEIETNYARPYSMTESVNFLSMNVYSRNNFTKFYIHEIYDLQCTCTWSSGVLVVYIVICFLHFH